MATTSAPTQEFSTGLSTIRDPLTKLGHCPIPARRRVPQCDGVYLWSVSRFPTRHAVIDRSVEYPLSPSIASFASLFPARRVNFWVFQFIPPVRTANNWNSVSPAPRGKGGRHVKP